MISRIDQLARKNWRPDTGNPCVEWDQCVEWRMSSFNEDRPTAVDKLLSSHEGSALWQRCCSWDAKQPKVVIEDGRETKTGNWLNKGGGTVRRIVRKP
jgi:hypothetical protein